MKLQIQRQPCAKVPTASAESKPCCRAKAPWPSPLRGHSEGAMYADACTSSHTDAVYEGDIGQRAARDLQPRWRMQVRLFGSCATCTGVLGAQDRWGWCLRLCIHGHHSNVLHEDKLGYLAEHAMLLALAFISYSALKKASGPSVSPASAASTTALTSPPAQKACRGMAAGARAQGSGAY